MVGIASSQQYYTLPVLNVYKQKTPLLWGYFVSMLRPNLLTGDDDEIKEAFYGKGPISSSKYLITKNLKIKEQPKAPKKIVPALLTNFCC